MTLRHLMILSGLLAVPYGVMCLLIPDYWLATFGGLNLSTDSGRLLARMYGGQVLGFGSVSLLTRNSPDGPTRRGLIRGFVLVDAVSLALAIYAVAAGITGRSGWLEVVGFALLVVGFGYFAAFPERADGPRTKNGPRTDDGPRGADPEVSQ